MPPTKIQRSGGPADRLPDLPQNLASNWMPMVLGLVRNVLVSCGAGTVSPFQFVKFWT